MESTKNSTINIDGLIGISLTNIIDFIREKIPDLKVEVSFDNIKEFKGKVLDLNKSVALLDHKQTIDLREWIHGQLGI